MLRGGSWLGTAPNNFCCSCRNNNEPDNRNNNNGFHCASAPLSARVRFITVNRSARAESLVNLRPGCSEPAAEYTTIWRRLVAFCESRHQERFSRCILSLERYNVTMRTLPHKHPTLSSLLLTISAISVITGATLCTLPARRVLAGQTASSGLAAKAQAILEKNCAQCHGAQNPAFGLNILKHESLLGSKMVLPGKAKDSELLEAIVSGRMPKGGGKMAEADIQILTQWIDAGAPDKDAPAADPGKPPTRKTLSEAALLKAIVRDLEAANERDRPYLRYYSLANLSNNPEVADKLLGLYRGALSKLVNHLSWNAEIVKPKSVSADGTLLRIDLRDYDWTPAIWQRIIAAYPYGLRARGLSGELAQIKALSGAELPYIRTDWFVGTASVAPLYHDILQLPENVADLEKKLQVNAEDNFAQDKVVRGGVRNSGVSHNNRVIERHRSMYGAYWKSYDFASNGNDKNIFLDPLTFHEDGGEFIFNLPNGLQAYMIANGQGKRLDEAPIKIVRDRFTNPDDPVVHNGRSCIGCHTTGMNRMQNEVRQMLETQTHTAYDLDKAKKIYVPQDELNRFFTQDDEKFGKAVVASGNEVPKQPADEPVNMLGMLYLADLTTAQAAADAGLDVKEFQKRVERSGELQKLGFGQLTIANGGIKRDAWEQYFGNMVEETGLGDCLKPTQFRGAGQPNQAEAVRRTVRFASFTGPQSREARQDLESWLRRSDDLQLVSGGADVNLTGTVTTVGEERVTIVVRDAAQGLSEEASGAGNDFHFLTEQLADKINLRLAGRRLGLSAAQAQRLPTNAAVPTDPALALQQSFGNGGPVKIALSIDRGPGSTYRGGEPVILRFKVDQDCFLQIKNLDSAGNVVNLFPNEFFPDAHVRAGQVYELKDDRGKEIITVDAQGVFGRETVLAFATIDEATLPGVKSKTLKVESQSASRFTQDVQKAAAGKRVSSASLQFFTER